MAWTDLSFPSGSKLTSTKMTEVQSNFAALAAGEAGAPPLAVNSLMWSGVASGAFLNVSSGFQTTEVGSFGSINAASGIQTTEVGSFGALTVNSGVALAAAPSTPPANQAFRDSICKGWINFNGTGTIAIRDSFNVASIVDNGTGDYDITWDTDFANTDYMIAGAGMKSGNNQINVAGHFATTKTAGSHGIACRTSSSGAAADPDSVYVLAMGEQ